MGASGWYSGARGVDLASGNVRDSALGAPWGFSNLDRTREPKLPSAQALQLGRSLCGICKPSSSRSVTTVNLRLTIERGGTKSYRKR